MIARIKRILKPLIPHSVLEIRNRLVMNKMVRSHDEIFQGKKLRHIFSEVYAKAIWGKAGDVTDQFFSGHGSHLADHVEPYVAAVSQFLQSCEIPQNVVDLGCGDFNVGSQIRQYGAKYIACDVVPDLIERNQNKFQELDVDFRCIDITEDPLPNGDVVIVRQVLQHLSNEHIKRVVNKLNGFKWLVLTEYVPEGSFPPNVDQPTGSFSRLARGINSGVVLTKEPFSLKVRDEHTICTSNKPSGLVTTIIYELQA